MRYSGKSAPFFLTIVTAMSNISFAADLTMIAVGAFGEASRGCKVSHFRSSVNPSGRVSADYADHFVGMLGRGLPLGNYDAEVMCIDRKIERPVLISQEQAFAVVSASERRLIGDHTKPQLTVRLEGATKADESMWMRLIGLYNNETYSDQFVGKPRVARVTVPEPGSYLVTIMASTGPVCIREIDLVEFTRNWVVRPADCSFDLDKFAHLVGREDKSNQKRSGWYEEMRAFWNEFMRGLMVRPNSPK